METVAVPEGTIGDHRSDRPAGGYVSVKLEELRTGSGRIPENQLFGVKLTLAVINATRYIYRME
jgi:hypothetical protein